MVTRMRWWSRALQFNWTWALMHTCPHPMDDVFVLNLALEEGPSTRRLSTRKNVRWTDRLKSKRVAKRKARTTQNVSHPDAPLNVYEDKRAPKRSRKDSSRLPVRSLPTKQGHSKTRQPVQIISSLFSSNPKVEKPTTSVPKGHSEPSNAPLTDSSTFTGLGLDPLITTHLTMKMDISTPTSIQRASLLALLPQGDSTSPRDAFIQSQTGSGKRLSYLLPVLHDLLPLSTNSYIDRSIGTLARIVALAWELAKQISDVLDSKSQNWRGRRNTGYRTKFYAAIAAVAEIHCRSAQIASSHARYLLRRVVDGVSRFIVFSCTDSVDFHWGLLGGCDLEGDGGSLDSDDETVGGEDGRKEPESSHLASILLCTSVAARGLDLPRMRAVLQYDLPTEGGATEYVHRVGCTARAGRGGQAWAIVAPSEAQWVEWVQARMDSGTAKGGAGRFESVAAEEILQTGFGGQGKEYEDRATEVQLAFEWWCLRRRENTEMSRSAFASHLRAYAIHPSDEKHISTSGTCTLDTSPSCSRSARPPNTPWMSCQEVRGDGKLGSVQF
ncbi:P-loop containing nucleoside triphosphate hydrolase protein [Lactarius quietus]|nr:P-loop containing nucleoside triphosphate hydrolase protein [Lactarius quietus]